MSARCRPGRELARRLARSLTWGIATLLIAAMAMGPMARTIAGVTAALGAGGPRWQDGASERPAGRRAGTYEEVAP